MPKRTTNQTLLEEALSIKSWPLLLYDIEIRDEGTGTAAGTVFTCTGKAYDGNEWQTVVGISDSEFIDSEGNTFTIDSNPLGNTLNLSGTPADGEFTLHRHLYLASMPKEYSGSFERLTFQSKYYLPYPVEHGQLEDHEVGKFPSLMLNLYNPGTVVYNFYVGMERYKGLKNSTVSITLVFIDINGDIYDDPDVTIVDKYIVVSSSITAKQITLELQNLGNFHEKEIPIRTYSKFTCDHVYKGIYCKYDGDIAECNKLETSVILQNLLVTNTTGETFQVPAEVTLPTDGTGLVGNKVIIGGEEYIWEIASNTSTTFTTTSGSQVENLSDFVDVATNKIIVSIIDKESCLGHTDSGSAKTPYYIKHDYEDELDMMIEKGNLLADSLLKSEYGLGTIWVATASGSAAIIKSPIDGIIITKTAGSENAYIEQSGDYPVQGNAPELNHHYIFYMQYYGFATTGTAYINVDVRFGFHGYRYWNFGTKTWSGSAQTKQLTLRSSSYQTNFEDGEFDRYVIPDEFMGMINLNWSTGGYSAPYVADSVYVRIGSTGADNVQFKCKIYRIGLYRYIPTEHAGSFPGIPYTRTWYV